MSGQLPPQNLEAERGVIGAALLEPSTLHDTASMLTPGDFYREAHQTIWAAILRLYDAGQAIDAVTLADDLTRRGQFKLVGGHEALGEIVTSIPHAANARFHAEVVKEKSIGRQLIQAATDILRDGYSSMHTAAELVSAAESRIFAISEAEATGETRGVGEVVGDVVASIADRREGSARGVQTGYGELDFMIDGFGPDDLCIVAGRPSMGKTAFAMGIATHAAQASPGHVLVVSLEMNRQSLVERLLCSLANVPGDKLRRPWKLTGDETGRLSQAVADIERLRIKIDDTPIRTLTQIGANARRVATRSGLSLLAIDYLSLIEGQAPREPRHEFIAKVSRGLKSLARQLKCPVLCLQQLNRQSEARKDFRPKLADLRESGAIEQDADQVLLLHRPDYYDPNDQPGIAEVIVAKNRNGPTGTVKLAFLKACTRFDSLSALPQDEPNGKSY